MSTMFKLTIVVIVAILLIQESRADDDDDEQLRYLTKCASGVLGDSCQHSECKEGYTCAEIKGKKLCCRDPVCPPGWLEGNSCKFPGNETCSKGYECQPNNFCCRSTFCPMDRIGPKCSDSSECRPGDPCWGGNCCRRPLCPDGWKRGDGVCTLTPQGPVCKGKFECNNDFCCKRPANCPSGIIGPVCKKNTCKDGYSCAKIHGHKICCRDSICPPGWLEGNSCNYLSKLKCSKGYECQSNNYCCRSTFCPMDSIGPECSDSSECKTGYTCRGGNCCRDPLCPDGWKEGDGVCTLTQKGPFCKGKFECNNGYCCKRPANCPSGIIGPVCQNKPCKEGYTCVKIKGKKMCCRDQVCPPGWLEGNSCNYLGNETCSKGYECQPNNFCCRSTFCPMDRIGPKCSHSRECRPADPCWGGNCCRRPLCPDGWKRGDGVCTLTPQGSVCKGKYECNNNDFCCKRPANCPSGVIGPVCKKNTCKDGYTCAKIHGKKFCCRDSMCPPGWLEGNSCNFLGDEKCSEGYECRINNFCCRSTVCPSGSIGPKCSDSSDCKSGYTCRSGYCCRDPLCQKGWKEGDGVCTLTPQGPICKPGFECSDDYCCKRPT